MRRCSRTGCPREARATLTYNYADSTVVVGPLSRRAEPHTYDLCAEHAARVTAPRGWEVLRLELPDHYVPVDGASPDASTAAPSTTDASTTGAAVSAPAPRPPAERPGLRVVQAADG